MAAIAVWRWVGLRLFRSPGVGLLWLALLACALLAQGLRPLPELGVSLSPLMVWAHPAGLAGVTLGLVAVSEGESFLLRVDPCTRTVGELGALLAAAIYLQLSILAAALLSGAPPADLGPSSAAILTLDLHLASVALLSLLPAFPTALRASLFLALAVVGPALCAHDVRLAPLAELFDASSAVLSPSAGSSLHSLAAGASLALCAYLLRSGPARAASA